jgi:predicted ABC-type ATPase
MSAAPWLWLLAGPNGAGKSTYAPNLAAIVEEVVGPDAIAQQLLPTAPEKATLTAGRPAVARKRELLRERQSFAVETTLSGRSHLRDVQQAKSEGWNVGVIYIGLASPALAIARVRERRLAGGHDVPPQDVRRRYDRSLRNLAVACTIADLVVVLDNSGRRPMTRVLEVRRGVVLFGHERLPKWLRPTLEALRRPPV